MFLEKYMSRIPEDSGFASDQEFFRGLNRVDLKDNCPAFGGVPLYSQGDVTYYDSSELHALIIGSTGSGKTRQVLLPAVASTLLGRQRSLVVFDVKGELYQNTHKLAKSCGYAIRRLDLRTPRNSMPWNPFAEANILRRTGHKEAAEIEAAEIAGMLCRVREGSKEDPFWANASRDLFRAIVDILWAKGKPVSMKEILAMRDEIPIDSDCDLFDYTRTYLPQSSIGYRGMRMIADLPRNTRGCVLSSFDTCMQTFTRRPDLVNMLSSTQESIDFSILGNKRTILYIGAPEQETEAGCLQTLILDKIQKKLTACAMENGGTLPVRVEMMVDELPNIRPSIPGLSTALAISRSRGIRYTLVIQTLSQLKSVYGDEADNIMNNCATWIVLYGAKDETLARKITALCGEREFDHADLFAISDLARMQVGQALILRERIKPYVTIYQDFERVFVRSEDDRQSA